MKRILELMEPLTEEEEEVVICMGIQLLIR